MTAYQARVEPAVLAIAILGAWAGVYYGFIQWIEGPYRLPLAELADLPAGLVAVVLLWKASSASGLTPRQSHGWKALSLAYSFYFVGNVLYFVLDTILRRTPFPSVADAAFLLFYPSALWGLFRLSDAPGARSERLTFGLDAAIVLLGAGTLIWYFLLLPIAHDQHIGALESILVQAYPLSDAVLLYGIANLLLRAQRSGIRRPVALLLVGIVTLMLGDLSFAYRSVQGTYHDSHWSDAAAAISNLFAMAAALAQRRAGGAARAEASPRRAAPFAALPYVAVALAYGLLLFLARDHMTEPLGGVLLAAVGLTALVVARQVVALQENARLVTERAARAQEARFRALVQRSSDVISVVDVDAKLLFVSPSAQLVFGHAPEALQGTFLTALVHPDDRAHALAFLSAAAQRQEPTPPAAWRVRHAHGRWLDVETIGTNLLDEPSVRGVVLNTRDVTERRVLEQELTHLAFHDSLTGLANRALFHDRLEHALSQRARTGRSPEVLIADLDDFKTVNDSLGHVIGDQILVGTAERLLGCVRASDTVARLGGDEFAILVQDTGPPFSGADLARRVHGAMQAPFLVEGREAHVSASIGIARAQGEESAGDLLRNADVAMYVAKSAGKGRAEVFEARMQSLVQERLDLEIAMRRALERGELRLAFQPVVDLRSGRLVSVEALLRWQRPGAGLTLPATFIRIAEETGLIVPLGRWVLREACRAAREWRDRLPSGVAAFPVSVNISARQLERVDLAQEVAAALREADLPADGLVLELTENVLMRDTDEALRWLRSLRSLGVRLAIDDFGTGYSSLAYLQHFPIDVLKVDKAFVHNLGRGPEGGALMQGILALGRSLRLDVVAEGIETAEQLEELVGLSCTLGQGFFLSVPVLADAIAELCADSAARGFAAVPLAARAER